MEEKKSEDVPELKTVQDLVSKASEGLGELENREASVEAMEAVALERLLDHLKPILRLVDRPILQARRWGSGRNGCTPWAEETALGRGIVLVDHIEQVYGANDQNRGRFTGDRLVLLRDGSLVKLTREGSWSKWQGEENHWEEEATGLAPKVAVKEYALRDILGGLVEALNKAIQGAEGKRRQLEGRWKLLQAVLDGTRRI
jgi:hypothetical protein